MVPVTCLAKSRNGPKMVPCLLTSTASRRLSASAELLVINSHACIPTTILYCLLSLVVTICCSPVRPKWRLCSSSSTHRSTHRASFHLRHDPRFSPVWRRTNNRTRREPINCQEVVVAWPSSKASCLQHMRARTTSSVSQIKIMLPKWAAVACQNNKPY